MKKPNIVIFNPDQYRGDVLGHMGDPAAVTPNLDRFSREDGVSFRNAYCQLPVCTPSRCSFMTGWYPHVRGHRSQLFMLQPDEPCLLKILKDNGYFVWWGGKNDLVPGQNGYDDYCDIKYRASEEDFRRWGLTPQAGNHSGIDWRGDPDGNRYYSFLRGCWDKGDEDYYCDGDWAMVLGAIDFINSYDGEQPVCIYLPLGYPHPPYAVEEPWFSMIDEDKLPPRRPEPELQTGKAGMITEMIKRHNLQSLPEEDWTLLRKTYYGMCARIDHQFGMIMDAVKDSGTYDDTAVFFFSDHGDFTGDYGLVNKNYNVLDDNLTKVPFLVKPAGAFPVKPGISDALVELTDFPATVYEMCGIDPGYWHFGKSLLPVFAGDKTEHRDAVFAEGGRLYGEKMWDQITVNLDNTENLYWPAVSSLAQEQPSCTKATMCRTQNFKYVHRLYEQDELYDMQADPTESRNLAGDPEYVDVLTELKERVMQFYLETTDVIPFKLDKRG